MPSKGHTEGNPLFIVETLRALLADLPPDHPESWAETLRNAIAGGALPRTTILPMTGCVRWSMRA